MNTENFEELMFLWREYATERDKYLTKEAQNLKQKILKFIQDLPELPSELANIPQEAYYLTFPNKEAEK
jgi:hypothetical protein